MVITAEKQATFRTRLVQERERIQGDLDELGADIATLGGSVHAEGSGVGNHIADDATDMAVQERDLALMGTLQERMREVDRALERLGEGNYGVCGRCGEPIPEERLEVRPFATLCVNCQSLVDRQRRPSMA